MANPMRLMWYINPNDGPFPWSPNGQYLPDLNRSRAIAVTLDRLGFYGALVVGRNPLVETASWVPLTRQMRFLIPIHPGATPPALLVQQAKLFDSISGGRLLMNQVNGTDQIMAHYGIDVPSNERYALSAEYWTLFKKLYAEEITGAYDGKYFKFAAPPMVRAPLASGGIFVQDPHTPVWGSGSSPDGIRHAGEVLDVYLTYLYRPDRLGPQLDEVRAAAATHGRTPGFGLLCNIILRDTDEEAWAHAQWVLDQTGPAQIVRQIEARLKTGRYNPATGSREAAGFASLTSDDPMNPLAHRGAAGRPRAGPAFARSLAQHLVGSQFLGCARHPRSGLGRLSGRQRRNHCGAPARPPGGPRDRRLHPGRLALKGRVRAGRRTVDAAARPRPRAAAPAAGVTRQGKGIPPIR